RTPAYFWAQKFFPAKAPGEGFKGVNEKTLGSACRQRGWVPAGSYKRDESE
ncbi:hypothetical protein TNCV_4322741, partial [Trichonephila clavipes]